MYNIRGPDLAPWCKVLGSEWSLLFTAVLVNIQFRGDLARTELARLSWLYLMLMALRRIYLRAGLPSGRALQTAPFSPTFSGVALSLDVATTTTRLFLKPAMPVLFLSLIALASLVFEPGCLVDVGSEYHQSSTSWS